MPYLAAAVGVAAVLHHSSAGILLAEDDPDDRFFFERAYKAASLPLEIQSVENGALAIKYLSGEGPFSNRTQFPLPNLIVTDLKMPGVNGFELIQWIRSQPQFRSIPVIVLSSSEEDQDKERAFKLGANGYLTKANGSEEMSKVVRKLGQWVQD